MLKQEDLVTLTKCQVSCHFVYGHVTIQSVGHVIKILSLEKANKKLINLK